MITNEQKIAQYGDILEELGRSLDLTDKQVQEAKDRYKAVGNYLQREDSTLAVLNPSIEPQGSFLLGTMIKPINEEGQYDIDLICKLENLPTSDTQLDLKSKVGDELKEGRYEELLDEEGQRCWTLNYAEGTKFHMDILPAIPDEFRELLFEGVVDKNLYQHALRMTDKEHSHFDSNNRSEWPKTNPKGYSEWFKEEMKPIHDRLLKEAAIKMEKSIEDVPDWSVKTPLQRAIQILKRHRDLMFGEDENKPISIIITTLAAKAYNQEDNVYEALVSILNGMEDHITFKEDGTAWVENPVNPKEENFADKWEQFPERKKAFFDWLAKTKEEILSALEQPGIHNIQKAFEKPLGKQVVKEAFINLAGNSKSLRESGKKMMGAGTGVLGTAGRTKVRDHDNYGRLKDE